MPLPEVVPAKEYRGDLLEPLQRMARTLRERGESIPPQWVEQEERDLRGGEALAWVAPRGGEVGGLLLLAQRPGRAFSHLYLTEEGTTEDEGRALARSLSGTPLPGTRRVDLTISAVSPETEAALARLLASPEFPFQTRERERMSRLLPVHDPPASLPLPPGFRFRWATEFKTGALARLDYEAFEASPDRGLVAESLEEDQRILGELLHGELGPLVREGSPVMVRESSRDGEEPVGLILSLQQGIGKALIADMAVSPLLRGRGLGKALLSRALRGLVAVGFLEVGLWVTRANAPARRLYAGAGFRVVRMEPIFVWERAPGGEMP